jgi:hypothetical protein
VILRQELKVPVAGYLVTARLAAAPSRTAV